MRVLLIVLAILYVVCPIDVIPDFIPVAGWADDVIIALLLGGTALAIDDK